MKPTVSIILPTYNGAQRIAKAIESIKAQSFQDWELLVIDDGSVDATPEVVGAFALQDSRIHYLKNDINLGIQKTLNKGLKMARGEYIARIDDDDIWIDIRKLAAQINYLQTYTKCVLVGTGVVVVDESDIDLFRYLLPETDSDIRQRILSKNCFVHSSVLFQKHIALLCGGYDESALTRHIEDYDLWLKLGTYGALANLPLYAVRFMLHPGSISANNKIAQFKKGLDLISRFRNTYPNYTSARIRSLVRLIVYGFVLKFPLKISLYKWIKLYKEKW